MPLEDASVTRTLQSDPFEEPPRLDSGTEYERSCGRDDTENAAPQGWLYLCVYPRRSPTDVMGHDAHEKRWASLARRARQHWMNENPY